jgi:hypothetical protein
MAGKIKIDGASKAPRKAAVRVRNPLFLDEKYTGFEPEWNGDEALKLSEHDFDCKLRKSMNYYNYFYNQKDSRKHVVAWLKTDSNLTLDVIKEYEKTPERYTPMTVCSLIMASKKKMPLKQHHVDFILESVQKAIDLSNDKLATEAAGPVLEDQSRNKNAKQTKQSVAKPTVRDRLNEIVDIHIVYFEEMESLFTKKGDLQPNAFNYFNSKAFPKPGIARFKKVFESKLNEMEEAKEGKDKQLKEGYSHFKTADFKKRIDFYTSILNDLSAYENAKKVARKPRVKKAVSKEKLVSKVKYCKQDVSLKVSSVNPVNIIGASEVWIFNIKYRKLGKYVADSHQGTLSIKGTSIIGYDEAKSVAKTLRKPEQQITEFMKAGKVALRKFLESIKAVESKLNGRLSEDVLILKVV